MSTIINPDGEPSPAVPATSPAGEQAISRNEQIRRAAPTAALVAVLAGLALWGHSSDWTLPKFSALLGGGGDATEAWCKDHNVPEGECIECRKDLLPPGPAYGWCKEHGISQCPLHHPDVAQLKTPAVVGADDLARAERALAAMPRTENNSRCRLHERRIQFASAGAADKAGIDIAVVERQPMIEAVTANGEIIYDETHTAHLASRVPGTVWRVEKQVGDVVAKGDILALVDSADVGRSKAELLRTIAEMRLKQVNVDRLAGLAADGIVPGKQLREATAELQNAQIQLLAAQQALVNLGLPVHANDFKELATEQIAQAIQYLGLPASLVEQFGGMPATSNLFPVRSPLDGVVVNRNAVAGETIDSGRAMFVVTDLRRMWLMLDVRQEDARYLALGQPVLFRASESSGDAEIHGKVAWISTAADDTTRTVKVRVDLPNDQGRLRANTFGRGRIVLREESEATVIPTEAVHWDGCCNVVFVRDKDYLRPEGFKFFHVRQVRLGAKQDATTEIIAGLLPGEVIASRNSNVLEAQLLKSNLGAGCCEVHTPKK